VYPLSTTMIAIINLTIQYFCVFTALALIRTFNGFMGIVESPIERVFKTAGDTVA
jgi:hypothetical protein